MSDGLPLEPESEATSIDDVEAPSYAPSSDEGRSAAGSRISPSAISWLNPMCTGFAGCNAQGRGNGGYESVYTRSFWNMFGGHNCTNYIAYRLSQRGIGQFTVPGNGDAKNWGPQARAKGYAVDKSNPQPGDVAWFDTNIGASGHVAYVESVDGDKVTVSEDNWGGNFHWRQYYIKDVTGFIHVTPVTPPPPPPADLDGDGTPDTADVCPRMPGPLNTLGCLPEEFDTSSLSDFNGDGFSDIAAFYDYGSGMARGFAFTGSSSGLANSGTRFWETGQGQFEGGRARHVSGDFNGDGYSDIATFYDYGVGLTRGFFFAGSTKGLASNSTVFWDSGQGNFEANRARFVSGDFNGDGYSDVVSFYDYGGGLARGFIFVGSSSGLANKGVTFWDSGSGNFETKRSKFVSGDFNGDGYSDIAVIYDYGSSITRGFMFAGSSSGLANNYNTFWDPGKGNFEASRARFVSGDFNGDSYSDIAAFYDYGGAQASGFMFAGSSKGLPNGSTRFWETGKGQFEVSRTRFVSSDSNGDGYSDITAIYDYGSGLTRGFNFAGSSRGLAGNTTTFWDSGKGNFEAGRARFVGGSAYKPSALSTSAPGISGTPQVGQALTLSAGDWRPTTTVLKYQWLRDGSAISGATKTTYTLTNADVGKSISVTVTGSKEGYTTTSKTSTPTAKIQTKTVTKAGWVQENGKWYYYANGVKNTGWLSTGGAWYYMNSSGVMQTGWVTVNGTWYYMSPSGAMQTGWVSVSGTWYFMSPSGAMQTGWVSTGGAWYYMKASGAMHTGWLKLGSAWYYLKPSGAMVTGTYVIDGATHRFNSSGVWLG